MTPPDVIVCVKQAVAIDGTLSLSSDERALSPGSYRAVPNMGDTFALEQALRLREDGLVRSVICLTAGLPDGVAMLTLALAMGADRTVRIDVDPNLIDELGTGVLLAAAIRQLGGSLVFTAQRSDDGASGIVPAAIARSLGAAYLSNSAAVRLAGMQVEVERKLERGNRQVWRARLPAVVAVEPNTLLPRYASVASLILARRREVSILTSTALAVDLASLPRLTELQRLSTPRRRPKKTVAPPVAAKVPGTAAARRPMAMGAIGGGSSSSKDKKVVTGSPEAIATAFIELLIEREIFPKGGSSGIGG
jgi:electron transfer flavoprotein beta subunit